MAAVAETAPKPTSGSLLQNRSFLSILIGHTISVIGDGFHSVALGLWVLQTTGSSTAMATIMAVRTLTGVLLGAVAGTVVDRTDRRRLMIGTDLARFVLVMLIAYMVTQQSTSFLGILVVSGLISLAGQFFGPAMNASLVNIVGKEQVSQASSLLQMINTLAQVVGPFIGGTVVALWGGWAAMVADASSFLISAAFILAGARFASPRVETEKRSFWGDFTEGFRYIKGHSLARGVVTIAPLINFFGNALGGVLLPVIIVKVWMATPFQFGMAEAAFPLGFAIGAGLFMAFGSKLRRRGLWMFGTMGVASLLMTFVPFLGSVTPAIPVYVLSGVFLAFPNVFFSVTLQAEVPTEVQGRVFGTLGSLLSAAAPLAFLVAGPLADMFPPVRVAFWFGVLLVATCLSGLVVAPALRDYN